MDDFFASMLLIILCVVIIVAINKENKTIGLCASIVLGIIVIIYVYPYLLQIITFINNFISKIGTENKDWIAIVLKVSAMALLGEWIITICKDAGENSLSLKVEVAIKVLIVAISIPILTKLIELLLSLLSEV